MTCQVLTLQLIKGVPSPYSLGAPAATAYDPTPLVIDFLTGVWRLKDDSTGTTGYDPGIAGLKNGGVNVDSPLLDNILPIAAPVGVVTDGLRITSPSDESSKTAALSEIMNTIRAASAFFFDTAQNEPVYLKVQLTGDAAPRYALVYDVQVDDIGDMLANEPHEIVLTFIREAYWRAIAPGANPKLYAFERRELVPNIDYDYADLSLTDYNNANADLRHFDEGDVENTLAYSGTTDYINYRSFGDDSDPDKLIPGDAPALTCIVVNADTNYNGRDLYVARNTKRFNNLASVIQSMTHNGGDSAVLGTGPGITNTYTVSAANGVNCDPPGAPVSNFYVQQIAFAAGAIVSVTLSQWTRPLVRNAGRYRVFVRGILSAGVGSDMPLQVVGRIGSAGTFFTSDTFFPATGLVDVGNFDFSGVASWINEDGTGLDSSQNYVLELNTLGRAGGAAVTYQLVDIILIPYDEYGALVSGTVASGGISTTTHFILDNTGYFQRAKEVDFARVLANTVELTLPVFGQMPRLEPYKNNILYFLFGGAGSTNTTGYNAGNNSMRVRINIIPRWRHLRDRV